MKNIIKSTFPIVLVIVLFCSVAFGDGDMSNGGKTCTGSNCPGFTATSGDQPTDLSGKTTDVEPVIENENPVLIFVKEFFEGIGMV